MFNFFSFVTLVLLFQNFCYTLSSEENNRLKRFDPDDNSFTVLLEPDEDLSPGIYFLLISIFHLISES
jgi:hypothetical protein